MALRFRSAAAPPARRRASFLTQGEIVAAAALVLERDGYDALNMRAVAAELRVQAAALYRHVKSRAELEDLLFDHLMADCAPRLVGKDWREDLAAVARAWRERLLSRRDLTRIALGEVTIGPNVAPLMDAALEALGRSGLDDRDLIEAYQACTIFVHGFANVEASYRDLAARLDRDLAARPDGVRIGPSRPEWAQAYPTLWGLVPALSAPADFEARFGFALAALIAGIEQRLAASSKSPTAI